MSGGAIGVVSSRTITVNGCTFTNCKEVSGERSYGGGAIYIASSETLSVTGSTFTECTSQCGGGVWTNDVKTVTLTRCTMIRCESSSLEGGGLRCNSGTCRLDNTRFESCRGPYTGGSGVAFINCASDVVDGNATACVGGWGAMTVQGGSSEIAFSLFSKNQVEKQNDGTVLYVRSGSVTIGRTLFTGTLNTDTDVCVYAEGGASTATLEHVCFENSMAGYYPITFYQQNQGQLSASVVDCYFSGASTWTTAGVIDITSESLHTNAKDLQCNAHTATMTFTASSPFTASEMFTASKAFTESSTFSGMTPTSSDLSSLPSLETGEETGSTSEILEIETSQPGGDASGLGKKVGIIVGSVVGVIVVVAIVAVVVMFCAPRCRKSAVIDRNDVSDMEILAFPSV